MHKTRHLFDYHFAKYIAIHEALPWESNPTVGVPPSKSTMIAHANCLLRYAVVFIPSNAIALMSIIDTSQTKHRHGRQSLPRCIAKALRDTSSGREMQQKNKLNWYKQHKSGSSKTLMGIT